MCVVSMIMDHHHDKWTPRLPEITPLTPDTPGTGIWPIVLPGNVTVPLITKEEIEEFRVLLERAREYDRKHHQPECELDEKRVALKSLARQLGVEIAFL